MISKTIFDDYISFGDLYCWCDPSVHTLLCMSHENLEIYDDEGLTSLLQFLNKDVREVDKSIKHLLALLTEEQPQQIELQKISEKIVKELIDWHPYFQFNPYVHLCDILLHYMIRLLNHEFRLQLYSNSSVNSNTVIQIFPNDVFAFKEAADTICSPFISTAEKCCLVDYYSTVFSHLSIKTDKPIPRVFTPLYEYLKLRTFICDNIPSHRPDRAKKDWQLFLDQYVQKYGKPFSYKTTVDNDSDADNIMREAIKYALNQRIQKKNEKEELIQKVYLSVEDYLPSAISNYTVYQLESFPHYIYTQLIELSRTKDSIKYCDSCNCYYLYQYQKTHIHPEWILNLIKIRDQAYDKTYRQCERSYDKGIIEKEAIEYMKSTGFYNFHRNTFNSAVKLHMSADRYSAYTNEVNYCADNYKKLPTLEDYIP